MVLHDRLVVYTGEHRPNEEERSMTTMTIPGQSTRRYKVKDQYNVIEFEGELIGEATTETDSSPRWTEIRIYKTAAGNYVVERVGVSLVYHDPDAGCASGVIKPVSALSADDRNVLEPCERCRPGAIGNLRQNIMLQIETDRHSAEGIQADALVNALTLRRNNGSKYVSNVAQSALNDALNHDLDLAEVLAVRTYIP